MGLVSGMFMGALFGISIMGGWRYMMRYRSNIRAAKAADIKLLASLDREDLKKLCGDNYPDWISFPVYEQVKWLNKQLSKMWPYVAEAAEIIIKDSVEPILEEYRPSAISSLKFSKLTLGTVAPKIEGIRIQSQKQGQITMDMDFRWGGNPDIVLGIEAGVVSLPIQLKDLQVFTIVRVIFQLCDEIPCISAVVVALLSEPKPRFDYTLRAVGGSLTAIPGISDMIDDIVTTIITDMLQWPHRIVVPLGGVPVDTSDLELKPQGKLMLTIMKANNLKNMEMMGKSDPYAVAPKATFFSLNHFYSYTHTTRSRSSSSISNPLKSNQIKSNQIKMTLRTCCCFYFVFIVIISSTIAQDSSSSSSSSVISRFQEYLKINTAHPSPNYQQAADFILSVAKSLSLESQTIFFVKNKPLVLLKWPGKDPKLPSILLNSHTDVVPVEPQKWSHPPFEAKLDDQNGNIYARGSQDMKCVGLQYLEAVRNLKKDSGFEPLRTIYISFVPDEEIGGHDGAEKFANSELFDEMNVGIVLDEGLASPEDYYRLFYAERCPMWLVIKASGAPGHGAKLYDNTAMENLLKSIESVRRFRASQFDLVKAGLKAEGEVVSVNMVFLKAGTPSPTGFVMNLQPSEAQAGFDIRVPPISDQASLERRIAEEWAPASRNMTFEFKQKVSVLDENGKPILTAHDSSNPWWSLLEGAIHKANGKFGKPEIFPASTDARYFRMKGVPAIGFSPMANTPILLHDHNEFLNKEEYLKGIKVYESILKAFASFDETKKDEVTKDEL